jgi:intracellular septation protein
MATTPDPRLKLALDFGPLLAFFVVNKLAGIYAATAVIMVLIPIAVVVSWRLEGKLPITPVVTAVIVLVMGGFTLYLEDERFIKIKPTIVYVLLGGALLGGLLTGRSFLKPLLGSAVQLREEGWIGLAWRWTGFFAFMAVLNEVVRRVATTDQWVTFKVFGGIALTFLFIASQVPYMKKHELPAEQETDAG